MDNSFITKLSIENIYENVNVYFIKTHNINLDSNSRYKKLVKKISKTVFNNLKNNEEYTNIVFNQFNDLILDKSKDFLLQEINSNNKKINNVKPKNKNLNNDNFNSFVLNNNDIELKNDVFNDMNNFDKQLKEAKQKIKDNFNEIIKSNNFKPKDSSKLVLDRCSINDDINANKLNSSAFDEILENKMENTLQINNENSYNNYSQPDIKEIISSVMFKQNDNSKSNQLESYEGETYLPNLITPIGEDAPIQPLIYQNTGTGLERIDKKIISIDSGTKNGGVNELTTVTNEGSNNWYKFRVDLEDNIKIDKLCDVYLRNITVIGITSNTKCNYLVIDIDEFNITNYSNNINMRDKINIVNTQTTGGDTAIFSQNYGSKDNYITTVNPSKLSSLNITITNHNGESVNDGNDKTFTSPSHDNNRIIFELEFINRGDRDEIIYEKNIYTSNA